MPVHYPIHVLHHKVVKLNAKQRRWAHIMLGASIAYIGVLISKEFHFENKSLHLIPDYVGISSARGRRYPYNS